MLEGFGFAAADQDAVLITIDKLDKIGQDGVIAELRERGVTAAAVDALETFFRRPTTMEFLPFGEAGDPQGAAARSGCRGGRRSRRRSARRSGPSA